MSAHDELDVLIVGAGFAGLYQLERLRSLGFAVKAYDAGAAIGGVWHWNAYPGARTDSWSPIYQFSREDLWRDWDFDELYPTRQKMVEYFDYVDAKLDLSRDVVLNTRVQGADFDEQRGVWSVRVHDTATGESGRVAARYLVVCTGYSSKPHIPALDGLANFAGEAHHTALWPQRGIELTGKRVAVVGTGASGIQVVQAAALQAEHLTVFQRDPVIALPMRQRSLDAAANRRLKENYAKRYAQRRESFSGFDYDFLEISAFDVSDEQRNAFYEQLWEDGGLQPWLGTYADILSDPAANRTFYDFWRQKVLARIDDPVLAEKLAPAEPPYAFGVKRPVLEQNYYETFNRDNVTLVDVHQNPIVRATPAGVITADGVEHPLDVIAFATGFDSVSGGITAIDIRGTDGRSFAEAFADGPRSLLGVATSGFPNLFYVYGPQSPSAFCNGPSAAELQGEWLIGLLERQRADGYRRIEASAEAERQWVDHVDELGADTLFPTANSPYMGANIPGKARRILCYAGGLPAYLDECERAAENDYAGFVRS